MYAIRSYYERSKKQVLVNAIPFLVFFLYFLIALLLKKGFAVDPATGTVSMESFKYLHNLLAMPVVTIILLVGA